MYYTLASFIMLLLPLVAAGTSYMYFSKKQSTAFLPFVLSCLATLLVVFYIGYQPNTTWQLAFYVLGKNQLPVIFGCSTKGVQMLAIVQFIALLVGIYSKEYLINEPARHRYFAFLSLFVFAMNGLLLAADLISFYVFWELVGLCSYLLIGFWYQKKEAILAAKKAFLMNRIGDAAFMAGILLVIGYTGHSSFEALPKALGLQTEGFRTLVSLLLFGGCIAKSAQFPLHSWLPDAMAGPTPVSALIHAATMVAAGIYLLLNIYPIFTVNAKIIIALVGTITMLMAGIKAFLQSDIKKVLAYSTMSQLGMMVLAVGIGLPNAAYLHLLYHAFFKAGLFLAAGAVIHTIAHAKEPSFDAQNLYSMGALYKKIPLTAIVMTFCGASMVGLPLFSGFISKDFIAEGALANQPAFFACLWLGAVLTAAYTGRLLWLVFAGSWRGPASIFAQIHSSSKTLAAPLLVLAFLSTFFVKYLIKSPESHLGRVAIFMLAATLLGLGIVYIFRNKLLLKPYKSVFDSLYDRHLVPASLQLSKVVNFWDQHIWDGAIKLLSTTMLWLAGFAAGFEKFIIDGTVRNIGRLSLWLGQALRSLQAGQWQWYISGIVLLVLLIFYFV
jgi:NADH-quinone oxidoreductase subunit L